MSKKINYQLFRQRKSFDPTILFRSNSSLSYKDFCVFFESRNVEPPSEEYYNRVKSFCSTKEEKIDTEVKLDLKEPKQPVLEETPSPEPVPVEEDKKETEEILEAPTEKPKRTRRKRKKKVNDEDSSQ